MKREWVDEMISRKRMKLRFTESLTHYGPVLFFVVLLVVIVFTYFSSGFDSKQLGSDRIAVALVLASVAVITGLIQYRRLQFISIGLSVNYAELHTAFGRARTDLGWRVITKNDIFLQARRPWQFTGSWGEIITIIRTKDGLLLNCVADFTAWPSLTTFGWSRKNLRIFLEHLDDVKHNRPYRARENIEKAENEWSFKRVLIRMIMYPLCLGFYALAFLLLIPAGQILLAIPVLSLCTLYIYLDIVSVRKWANRKR